ncbi:putative ribonuclease H-like domain-containing protein [Tanacetum coccineum]
MHLLFPHVPNVFSIDDTGIFDNTYDDEDVGAKADLNNLETTMNVSPNPTTRIDKDHPKDQIIGDLNSAIQTRRMTKISYEHVMKVIQALEDPSWVEAMQEELLQFKHQKVWTVRAVEEIVYDLMYVAYIVETKARLVAQGYTQEEGIYYDEMDVKSAFLYGTIEEESWYETLSTYLIENGFRRGTIDKTLFIKKDKGDILLVQVYVDDIIFGSTKNSLCDEFEGLMHKRFQMSSMGELTFFLGLHVQEKEDGIFISQDIYDEEAEDIDVHLYNIKDLVIDCYLNCFQPDINVCCLCCAWVPVYTKTSHIHAVKRIFRYLKGQPKLGLWYPRDSPFDLEAFSDSDYAGASLDRKSITREYVAAANCCGQVLWIQNQMLDYGFNFMNTKIYIDNESTSCIVKDPTFHSKTKHIEIRHHFIRDSYEKKLIQVIKIHTDHNVADLLTKAFDVGDEAVHKELGDRMERAATTASSLEVEQDSDVDAQTRFETTSKQSNDPPLSRGYTLGSGEDSMKLLELMELCTKLSNMLHKNRKSDLVSQKK